MQPYFIVDVFAAELSGGNAAGVVLSADGLTDERMQKIAKKFNLSETTFVLSANEVNSTPAEQTGNRKLNVTEDGFQLSLLTSSVDSVFF